MKEFPNIDKLKEALAIAENTLEKEEDSRRAKKKRKRISKAVERAYETLITKEYTAKDIDKRTEEIWVSMMDDDHRIALLIFFFGFVLAGVSIFTIFQAYNFFKITRPDETPQYTETELRELVSVEYVNSAIVQLQDVKGVPDEIGLDNEPLKFMIKNNSGHLSKLEYLVNYSVKLMPIDFSATHSLEKRHIKYKYIYTNSWDGRTYESRIGTLEELETDADGSMTMMTGAQIKDANSDFKIVFWLSTEAPESADEQTLSIEVKVEHDVAVK